MSQEKAEHLNKEKRKGTTRSLFFCMNVFHFAGSIVVLAEMSSKTTILKWIWKTLTPVVAYCLFIWRRNMKTESAMNTSV